MYLAHAKVYLLKHIFVLQVNLPGGANLLFLLIKIKKKKHSKSKIMSSSNELSLYSHSPFYHHCQLWITATTENNLQKGFCSHSAWYFVFQAPDPCHLYVSPVNTLENFSPICQHPIIKGDYNHHLFSLFQKR